MKVPKPFFPRSRTSTELQRRCTSLLTVIEREMNGDKDEKGAKRGADRSRKNEGAKKSKKEVTA